MTFEGGEPARWVLSSAAERGQTALETRRWWGFLIPEQCVRAHRDCPCAYGGRLHPQAVLCYVHVRIGEAAACNGPVTPRTLCLSSALGGGGVLASMGKQDAPSHRHSVQQACVCPSLAPPPHQSPSSHASPSAGRSQSRSISWNLWAISGLPGLWLHPSHLLHGASPPWVFISPLSDTFVEEVTLTAPF